MSRVGYAALLFAVITAMCFGVARAQFAGEPSPSNPKNVYDEATRTPGESEPSPYKNSKEKRRELRARLEEAQAELDAEQALTEQDRKSAEQRAAKARARYLGYLQTGNPDSLPRLYQNDRFSVIGSFDGGVAPFVMFDNVFHAPPRSIYSGLPVNPGWIEAYAEPGVTAEYRLARGAYAYGGFSYLESGTIGTDYTGGRYAWYGLPEELYAGVHLSHLFGGRATLDASFGQQNYTIGNGMLISLGATNGLNRGAIYVGPRTAWRQAALLRTTEGDWSTQFFYLRPNEASAAFDNTTLTGVNVVWNPPGQLRLGAEYIYSSSDIATRNQMSAYEFRARLHPLKEDPAFWLQADYSIEGKPQVAADGWSVQANYNFPKMWWKPFLNVGYYRMSGANPANAVIWNGFDPFYFGGSVPAWLPGFALQTQLANTNLRYFDTSIAFSPGKSDSLQVNYLVANVDQLNAILTTVPPSTTPSAAGGLPSPGYGQELGASYVHNLTASLSLNPFYAYAWPGSGIAANYSAHGGTARNWTSIGVAFTASY
jgi:hypothetical protein